MPGITPEKLDRIRAEKAAEAAAAGTTQPQNTSPQRLSTMDSLAQQMSRGSVGSVDVPPGPLRTSDDPFARSSLSGYSANLPSLTSSGQYYPSYQAAQQGRPSTSGGMPPP